METASITAPAEAQPQPLLWDSRAARFYLNAIDLSNYEQRVGGALRSLLGDTPSLLDIGAGSGVPGAALLAEGGRWTTLEPNLLLANHLASRPEQPQVYTQPWQALGSLGLKPHAVVLAANMPGPLDNPGAFLDALVPLATRAVAWVVPAQCGPRRYCLADFLPADLHGEDCQPAIRQVLATLPPTQLPDVVREVDWTFTGRFSSHEAAQAHFEERFNPSRCSRIRATISKRLDALPMAADGSIDISVAKRSACLIWWRSE